MPANFDAWELWQAVEGQVRRSAFGQPIGLDYGIMLEVAKILEIQVDRILFAKMQALENAMLAADLADSNQTPEGG